jgi:hypothetical protein
MINIRDTHNAAVAAAKLAKRALLQNDRRTFIELSNKALELAKIAAYELMDSHDSEPTRSVLFRTSAFIAFQMGNYHETLELVDQALTGRPYEEISEELQSLRTKAQIAVKRRRTRARAIEYTYQEFLAEQAAYNESNYSDNSAHDYPEQSNNDSSDTGTSVTKSQIKPVFELVGVDVPSNNLDDDSEEFSDELAQLLGNEIIRVKELIKYYDNIPNGRGGLASSILNELVGEARESLLKFDVELMTKYYNLLLNCD